MSVGSFGLLGSIAGTPLAQSKGSDIDKAKADTSNQQRQADGAHRADAAAGVGVTQEDSQTSDRDADGRRIWELGAEKKKEQGGSDSPASGTAGAAKDPSGLSGTQLDLSG